ncbi:MAG: hypothetical protein ABJA67_17955 [Chthonomonadales bacterium]
MSGEWQKWKIGGIRVGLNPLTSFICLFGIITFFSAAILQGSDPFAHLAFTTTNSWKHFWTYLTWPLYTGFTRPLFTIFSIAICYWICGSLERSWGTSLFARAFVVSTLSIAILLAILCRVMNAESGLYGLWIAVAPPIVAWGVINRRETVLLFCILPIPAMVFAVIATIVAWWDVGPPILGLSAVAVCGLAYWYIIRGRDSVPGNLPDIRAAASRICVPTQHGEKIPTKGVILNPAKWLKERQERKRFEKLFGGPDGPGKGS